MLIQQPDNHFVPDNDFPQFVILAFLLLLDQMALNCIYKVVLLLQDDLAYITQLMEWLVLQRKVTSKTA